MPNGDDDFVNKLPELNLFFSRIEPTITAMAKDHNLEISKYYHEGSSWDLCFSHPKGGAAKIQIVKEDNINDRAAIFGCWWLDDYDSFSRSIKNLNKHIVSVAPEQLRQVLEESLTEILSWELGEWTSVHSDYQVIWGKNTKQDFERMGPKYSYPK
jgi:hypothetical protein